LKESKIYDTIIIGGGPAGISAAIQLKRSGISPLLIEKDRLGGSLLNANLIENYLGFPEGISGIELVKLIINQFNKYNIQTLFTEVKLILKNKNHFEINTINQTLKSRSIILATGSKPRKLNIEHEDQLYTSKKLFYELKEIPQTNNKHFTIIGGGDAAFDYALNLAKNNKVTIICRNTPKCIDILKQRVENNNNISVLTNQDIRQIEDKDDKLKIICRNITIETDHIIVAIGKTPNILTEKQPGIFFAGDVNNNVRYLNIAEGEGLIAAEKVKNYLNRMEIISEHGKEDIATVYIGKLRNNNKYLIEFAESFQRPLPIEKKWVLLISTLFGCPTKCPMCDAGLSFNGKLTTEEIFQQIDFLVNKRFPNKTIPSEKFKIQFARIGEPAFNSSVLEVLKQLPTKYNAPGLMPCISTIAPANHEKFFEELIEIKNNYYNKGNFQLQFSIHSTNQENRDKMIPTNKWNFRQISEYGERFFKQGDRKITLNFAAEKDNPIDPEIIKEFFNPNIFIIKFTPINPTENAKLNNLNSLIDPINPQINNLLQQLNSYGFETILSIGDLEENNIKSNCGQILNMVKHNEN